MRATEPSRRSGAAQDAVADTAAALVCADPRRARLLHVQSIEPITLVRRGLQDDNDFELIRLRLGTEQ